MIMSSKILGKLVKRSTKIGQFFNLQILLNNFHIFIKPMENDVCILSF